MGRLFLILQLALTTILFLLTSTGAIAQIYLGLTDDAMGYILWASLIGVVGFLFIRSCKELKQDLKD